MNERPCGFVAGAKGSRRKLQKHHKTKPAALIQNIKSHNAIKASKTMVLAKKQKLHDTLKKSKYLHGFEEPSGARRGEPREEERGRESDDSIGSASDLRDMEEASDEGAVSGSEIESLDVPSVYTCGSSVYHAECESMTASNTFETRRRRRVPREGSVKPEEKEAGEEAAEGGAGEKPLLDEFDSDGSPQFWDTPWDNETKDVFAMAPFQKPEPEPSGRSKPEKMKRDLLTFSESDSQQDEERTASKSPNLIILSESDSDLKKPRDSEETQTLLTNQSRDVAGSRLVKDVSVTETLHLVREKLKPLEKLEEPERMHSRIEIVDNPSFYENNHSASLFSDDEDENFPTKLHGFSPKYFQQEKAAESKDIFGFSPFHVLPSNRNPFEGDDFRPEVNDENVLCNYPAGKGRNDGSYRHSRLGSYEMGTNAQGKMSPSSPDDKLLSPNSFDERPFVKAATEKESKVHFSLSDKILNFKSEKKIYYDSLKQEEKARKKMEEKTGKSKNCEKGSEKSKKHKMDKKAAERGFSNMSFEDCFSGEDNHLEEEEENANRVENRLKRVKPLHRRSNPFT